MSPLSRGSDATANGTFIRTPGELPEKVAGLGILSIEPAVVRDRSYTIDSLNISPIEASAHTRAWPEFGVEKSTEWAENAEKTGHWEQATWEFSDLLQSLSGKERDDLAGVLGKCNRLVLLLQRHPQLKAELVVENVVSKVQFMLYDLRPQARAAAYRLLRYTVATSDAVSLLVSLKMLIFLIVSLSTATPMLEKEQALKLVREFVNIPGGVEYLSVGIIKALVAYIEHESDETATAEAETAAAHEAHSFTRMCIETIAEIAVLNPDIVFHGGGMRLLIHLVANGAPDVAVGCLPTLLTLLDMPHARLFLRNGADLDGLMAVFTLFEDDDATRPAQHKKYHAKALKIAFVLTCLLKTWSGVICFSHDNFAPVRMLLSNLRKRNARLTAIILDILLDILRIHHLPWLEDSSLGDLLALVYPDIPTCFEYLVIDPRSFEYGVISHYQGLLLKIFINCGVVPLLFNIVDENRDAENTTKATKLLTNLLDLCASTLPQEFYNAYILSAYNANLLLSSLAKIEAASRMRRVLPTDTKTADVRVLVRDLTQQLRADMKDGSFKSLISGTKLLSVKEFDAWNWSQLSQLFQGPLRNPTRFAELQEKYPKFLKTFLSFLRPFKYRFSSVPITASSRYPNIRKPKNLMLVACQLVDCLLAHDEGSRFLSSNKLMPQIAEIFAQIDPLSGIESTDPILAKRRLEHSLSVAYVKMVGIMSGSPRGIDILEQWQLFHMMSNIIDTSVSDDTNNYLIFNILHHLDYTRKGHSRLILSKALSISNWKVKVYALENVFPILRSVEGTQNLYVLSLVRLLYDPSDAVTKMAIECLYDYFILQNNLEIIDLLIECKPSVSVLEQSKEGRFILLNFCTTSKGFKYLDQNGYIEENFLKSIQTLQTLDYLTAVEQSLRKHLFPYTPPVTDSDAFGGTTLRHFFHYLLATEEGFNYFNSRRAYIDEAVSSIKILSKELSIIEGTDDTEDYIHSRPNEIAVTRNASLISSDSPVELANTPRDLKHWPPSANWAKSADSLFEDGSTGSKPLSSPDEQIPLDDEYLLKRLKQYIWMIGEIASANYGIQILEPVYSSTLSSGHIAETLALIFEQASHWQLRGLAFFQLGKMAGTVEGVEILDDLQWISFKSPGKYNLSLAYPKFMQEEGFTKVELLNPYKDASYYSLFGTNDDIPANGDLDLEDEIVIESYEEIDEKILTLFNYLSSVLGRIERKATKELTRIKTESPQVFGNINLFLKTIRLIDKGKFKYRSRMFIFDLFNTMKIMEGLVKKDRKNSSARRQAI